jgi:GAF domain-containing protein/HAMP domain-containing protein
MKMPSLLTRYHTSSSGDRAPIASRILLVTSALFTLTLLFTAPLVSRGAQWAAAAAAAGGLIGVLLSRRGRTLLGIELFLGILAVASWIISFTIAGSSMIVALILIVISNGITLVTLTPPWIRYNVIGTAIAAVVAILLDLYGPTERPAVSTEDLTPLALTIGLLLGGYLLLLFRQFRNFSLRTKLIILFMLVMLISIGALSLITTTLTRNQLTEDIGNNLKNTAQTQALAVGNDLEQAARQLQAFSLSKVVQDQVEATNRQYELTFREAAARNAELAKRDEQWKMAYALNAEHGLMRERLSNESASELNEYHQTFPENLEILVTDQYGALVAATNPIPSYLQTSETWWQAAYHDGKGQVYISQPLIHQRFNSLYVIIALPLYGHGTQEVIGVLRTSYRIKTITELLKASRAGQGGRLELYLPNSQKIGGSGLQIVSGDLDASTLARLMSATSQYLPLNYQRAPSFVTYAPVTTLADTPFIRQLNWLIIVHQPRAEALRLVDTQIRATILLTLGVVFVTVLIAMGAAQLLANPIVRLTETAEQIATGDLNVRAASESHDEVGRLAATFNHMTNQLQHTLHGLEQRVQERTAELAQQTAYLTALNEVSISLLGRLDLESLLRDILVRAGELVGAPHGFLYLSEPGGQTMQMRVGTGAQRERVGNRIQPGVGLAGQIWASGEAMVVNDYQNWSGRLALSASQDSTLRAVAGVPLIARDQIIGVLGLAHVEVDRMFSENEIAILKRFAPLASLALENARLFEQTQQTLAHAQRQAERRHTISQLTNQLHRAPDLQSVMRIAAEELRKLTGSQRLLISFEPNAPNEPDVAHSPAQTHPNGKENAP